MNNSVYGKTIETKRRRLKVHITRDAEKTAKLTSKFEFDKFKIFGENMAAICSRPKVIKWTTPNIVGVTILDFSKLRMYGFHYGFADLAKKKEVCTELDFSNYPAIIRSTPMLTTA